VETTQIDKFMALYPYEGLTFDDVSLSTQYADFQPHEGCVRSRFSRNIELNIPLVSAAMDTVTESAMAIAMAMEGGIGVIHKNLSAKEQAHEVGKVKYYLNGLIERPIAFPDSIKVSDLLAEKDRRQYKFTGFPITDADSRLVGIVTARDIKFLTNYEVPITDVMTSDPTTAPVGTTLLQAHEIMVTKKIGKLPIVDEDGRLAGLYSFHDVKSLIAKSEPNINRDSAHKLRVAAAVSPGDYDRCQLLIDEGVDALVIDTAHGHTKGVIDTIKFLKSSGAAVDVVAGNIGTAQAAKDLIAAGADALKVGIGPGSICTTRVVCGVGIPQLRAVYDVYQAARGEVPIIADGGIKHSGDIPKAVAVGGDAVMMGSALAGTAESPGEKILHQGRRYVVYRGMGSMEAMKAGQGSRERYSQGNIEDSSKLVPQGIEGLVQFRGSVESVLTQFAGGLRFSLGYCGARNLSELRRKAHFVRVSSAGLREAHPHDVKIIKDAPNYSSGNG
jgi:IMP dehydrogenase